MEIYNRIPMSTRITFISLCLKAIKELASISERINTITELMAMKSEYLNNFNISSDLIILAKSYISYLDEIVTFNHDHYFLENLKKVTIPSIETEVKNELEELKEINNDYLVAQTKLSNLFKYINASFSRKMPIISVPADVDLSIPEASIKMLSSISLDEMNEFEQLIDFQRKLIGERFLD